jgi:hypothetical protein
LVFVRVFDHLIIFVENSHHLVDFVEDCPFLGLKRWGIFSVGIDTALIKFALELARNFVAPL